MNLSSFPVFTRENKKIEDPRKCFFCKTRRKRNMFLVSEDAIGNPELPEGMGLNAICKAIKYREEYKRMRRIYWVCLRCFYIAPRDNRKYRSLQEKKEVNLMKKLFCIFLFDLLFAMFFSETCYLHGTRRGRRTPL
jgi:hypothetical protein